MKISISELKNIVANTLKEGVDDGEMEARIAAATTRQELISLIPNLKKGQVLSLNRTTRVVLRDDGTWFGGEEKGTAYKGQTQAYLAANTMCSVIQEKGTMEVWVHADNQFTGDQPVLMDKNKFFPWLQKLVARLKTINVQRAAAVGATSPFKPQVAGQSPFKLPTAANPAPAPAQSPGVDESVYFPDPPLDADDATKFKMLSDQIKRIQALYKSKVQQLKALTEPNELE